MSIIKLLLILFIAGATLSIAPHAPEVHRVSNTVP